MVNKQFWHISDFVLASYTFGCVKMSFLSPNNRHSRKVLIFFFYSKKTAAEAHRELQKVYGDAAPSETTCHDWFRLFKDGDFDDDDRPREGRRKIFEDAELEALFDEDPCQTQEELASALEKKSKGKRVMGTAWSCFYVVGSAEYSRCEGYAVYLVGPGRC